MYHNNAATTVPRIRSVSASDSEEVLPSSPGTLPFTGFFSLLMSYASWSSSPRRRELAMTMCARKHSKNCPRKRFITDLMPHPVPPKLRQRPSSGIVPSSSNVQIFATRFLPISETVILLWLFAKLVQHRLSVSTFPDTVMPACIQWCRHSSVTFMIMIIF